MLIRIKQICSQKGITLQELAKRLGIGYQALYESATGNPSLKRIRAIADALGVEVIELFEAPSKEASIICPHCGKPITIKAE